MFGLESLLNGISNFVGYSIPSRFSRITVVVLFNVYLAGG